MQLDAYQPALRGQHVRSCIDRLTVRTKIWLEVDGQFVIGEHGLELLKAVDQAGSLAAAARLMGWSYRHAWGYVRRAETALGRALLVTKQGKGIDRGAKLSLLGRKVLSYSTGFQKASSQRLARKNRLRRG